MTKRLSLFSHSFKLILVANLLGAFSAYAEGTFNSYTAFGETFVSQTLGASRHFYEKSRFETDTFVSRRLKQEGVEVPRKKTPLRWTLGYTLTRATISDTDIVDFSHVYRVGLGYEVSSQLDFFAGISGEYYLNRAFKNGTGDISVSYTFHLGETDAGRALEEEYLEEQNQKREADRKSSRSYSTGFFGQGDVGSRGRNRLETSTYNGPTLLVQASHHLRKYFVSVNEDTQAVNSNQSYPDLELSQRTLGIDLIYTPNASVVFMGNWKRYYYNYPVGSYYDDAVNQSYLLDSDLSVQGVILGFPHMDFGGSIFWYVTPIWEVDLSVSHTEYEIEQDGATSISPQIVRYFVSGSSYLFSLGAGYTQTRVGDISSSSYALSFNYFL